MLHRCWNLCGSTGGKASGAAFAGGTIEGKVTARPAKYTAGTVVYLKEVPGSHPPPREPVVMDQKGMKFVPHVLPIVRGTRVRFVNSDTVRHNVFSPDGEKYDLGTWPTGESREYLFKQLGVYTQLCNVHPEMEAFVVVLQNPYFAVTAEDGRYKIDGVPPGKYTLSVWNEKLKGDDQPVEVQEGKAVTANFTLKR